MWFPGWGDPPQEQRHISVFSALTLLTPAHSSTDEEDLEKEFPRENALFVKQKMHVITNLVVSQYSLLPDVLHSTKKLGQSRQNQFFSLQK